MGGARDELRCPSLGSTPWLEGLTNKGKVFNHSTSSLPLAAYNLTATKVKNKSKFIFNLPHRHREEFGAWNERECASFIALY